MTVSEFNPTEAVDQIRAIQTRIIEENDQYWADPSNDEDPGTCGDHYDALSEMYEEIATITIELDQWLYEGKALPEQWKGACKA